MIYFNESMSTSLLHHSLVIFEYCTWKLISFFQWNLCYYSARFCWIFIYIWSQYVWYKSYMPLPRGPALSNAMRFQWSCVYIYTKAVNMGIIHPRLWSVHRPLWVAYWQQVDWDNYSDDNQSCPIFMVIFDEIEKLPIL